MSQYMLSNQIALVTGGSRGIGRATVEHLASQGATVVFVGRNEEALLAAEQEMQQKGRSVSGIRADVSQAGEAQRVVDAVLETHGQVDILVNNAGITRDTLAMRMKDEDWEQVLQVNLTGAFYMARAVQRPMMKARQGKIINVTSVVGLMGNAGQVNYAASKAGLIGMTKSLAKELAPRGIQVNAVAPGFIETQMTEAMKPEAQEAVLKQIPLGRYGKPEEAAALIGFLASSGAGYITGQVMVVDGGLHM